MAGRPLLEGAAPVETHLPHGTRSTYVNAGCRCDACREGNTRDIRRMVENRAVKGGAPHGTVGGYTNWKCRCPACTAAHAARCRLYWRTYHRKATA